MSTFLSLSDETVPNAANLPCIVTKEEKEEEEITIVHTPTKHEVLISESTVTDTTVEIVSNSRSNSTVYPSSSSSSSIIHISSSPPPACFICLESSDSLFSFGCDCSTKFAHPHAFRSYQLFLLQRKSNLRCEVCSKQIVDKVFTEEEMKSGCHDEDTATAWQRSLVLSDTFPSIRGHLQNVAYVVNMSELLQRGQILSGVSSPPSYLRSRENRYDEESFLRWFFCTYWWIDVVKLWRMTPYYLLAAWCMYLVPIVPTILVSAGAIADTATRSLLMQIGTGIGFVGQALMTSGFSEWKQVMNRTHNHTDIVIALAISCMCVILSMLSVALFAHDVQSIALFDILNYIIHLIGAIVWWNYEHQPWWSNVIFVCIFILADGISICYLLFFSHTDFISLLGILPSTWIMLAYVGNLFVYVHRSDIRVLHAVQYIVRNRVLTRMMRVRSRSRSRSRITHSIAPSSNEVTNEEIQQYIENMQAGEASWTIYVASQVSISNSNHNHEDRHHVYFHGTNIPRLLVYVLLQTVIVCLLVIASIRHTNDKETYVYGLYAMIIVIIFLMHLIRILCLRHTLMRNMQHSLSPDEVHVLDTYLTENAAVYPL